MESYNKLLDEAYKKVKVVEHSERFEIPKVEGRIQGNKTIISNFAQICSVIRRKPEHVAKFLFKELATPGKIDNSWLVLNRKISSGKINDKIAFYVNEFVLCKECGKPDTEIIKQDGFLFLHCLACGAKKSLSKRI